MGWAMQQVCCSGAESPRQCLALHSHLTQQPGQWQLPWDEQPHGSSGQSRPRQVRLRSRSPCRFAS